MLSVHRSKAHIQDSMSSLHMCENSTVAKLYRSIVKEKSIVRKFI